MKGKKSKAIVSMILAGLMLVSMSVSGYAQTSGTDQPELTVMLEEITSDNEQTEADQVAPVDTENLIEVLNSEEISGWLSQDAVVKLRVSSPQPVEKVWFSVSTGEEEEQPQTGDALAEGLQQPSADLPEFNGDLSSLLYDAQQAADPTQLNELEIPVSLQSQDWAGTLVTVYVQFADGVTEGRKIPVYIDKAAPEKPEILEAPFTDSGVSILFSSPLKQASGSKLYVSDSLNGKYHLAFNEKQPTVFELDYGKTIYLKAISGAGLESSVLEYTAPEKEEEQAVSDVVPGSSSLPEELPSSDNAEPEDQEDAPENDELDNNDESEQENLIPQSIAQLNSLSKMASGNIVLENGSYYFVYTNGTKALNEIIWLPDGARIFDSQGKMHLGWYTLNGNKYYANPSNGLLYCNLMPLLDGSYYYFDKDGIAAVSTIKNFTDGSRIYDDVGRMRLGWYKLADKLYYADPGSGILYQDTMLSIGGYYYYFTKDGSAALSTIINFADGSRIYDATGKMQLGWYTLSGENYYADPGTGVLLKKRFFSDSGYYYYLKENGAAAKSQVVNFSDGSRIFDDGGRMRLGWHELGGKLYYANPNSGILYQGGMWPINGSYYFFNLDGSAAKSEIKNFADGKRIFDETGRMRLGWYWLNNRLYYANPNSGILYRDSMQVISGSYFYFNENCEAAVSSIVAFPDGKRIFDEAGRMQLGWYTLGGNRYYASPASGILFSGGLRVIGNSYYYFDTNGIAAVSKVVQLEDGARVFDGLGRMLTGLNWVEGKLYYSNPATGLLHGNGMWVIGGYYYYFGSNYAAAIGVFNFADGPRVFDSMGRMVVGWHETNGKLYYADPAKGGILAGPGGCVIGGKWYQFEQDYSATRNKMVEQGAGKYVIFGMDGSLQIGLYNLNGKQYFAGPDGLLVKGWVSIPGTGLQYYFGNDFAFTGQTKADITRGIDVSAHQGAIDWAAVAASGQVDFAIIRALTWSSTVKYYVIDPYFDYNVRQAKAHGIKVGVYLFTYAFNNAEMQEEINFFVNSSVMKNLKRDGVTFELPVFIDFEYDKALYVTSYQQRTDMLRYGMVLLEQSGGYRPGFYSNLSWANTHYNARQLEAEGYPFWLANYGKYHAQDKPVNEHNWGSIPPYIWQYTSKGRISGINTDVDLNYLYGTYGSGGVTPPLPRPEDYTISVFDQNTKQTVTDTLENILLKVVAAEMGTGQPIEAYKAQAVAAHSWLRYQFENGNSLPQVALNTNVTNDMRTAVSAVKKEIATYDGRPALTMYSASNSGVTNSAVSFFQAQNLPYLASVSDPGGIVTRYINKATVIGRKSFNGLANTGMEYAISKMLGRPPTGDPSTWIGSIHKDAYGYVDGVTVCGTWVSASTFYDNLYGLFSPNISSVTYSAQNQSWTFVTNGNGHCVGMSQTGALAHARNGWDYRAILNYYYRGVSYQNSDI